MSTMRWAAALGAALLISVSVTGAPAPLHRGERLEWRFVAGKPFYQKIITETSQKMTVMRNEVAQTQKLALVVRWTPVRRLPDRTWVVKQKFEAIRIDVEVGGSKISYDSTRPGVNNPLAAAGNALLGTELVVMISPRLKVTRVEGREALGKKLGKANPPMQAVIEALLSENGLKEMAESLFAGLPGKRVEKGYRWTETNKGEPAFTNGTWFSPGLPGWTNRSRYVFQGRDPSDKRLGRIVVTQKRTFNPVGQRPAASGAPFNVVKSDFKTGEGTGTILVNLSKGRIERSQITQRLSGRMTIEIGDQRTEVELDQTLKTTVTTSEKKEGL
jgi:hypothetical protein